MIDLKNYSELFKFFLSFFAYSCGIAVIISYATIFSTEELGFSLADSIKLIVLVNITSSIGAALFGILQDHFGSKNTIIFTLILWMVVTVGAYLITTAWFQTTGLNPQTCFWFIANICGLAIGSSQASSRAMVGLLSPPEKIGEFFGFWGVLSRLASTLGVFTFGTIAWWLDSRPIAILCTTGFFFVGLILLTQVKEPEKKTRDQFLTAG